MSTSGVLQLLSGVALFLFGMSLMGDGLKKVAGNKLELILYRLSSTPIKGILLGTGVTAAIQSSSATSVMVVGFVNSGMMKVKQAIGVIMGAIIGTSITGWIICLSSVGGSSASGIWEIVSTDTFTALMAITGIILKMFTKSDVKHHLGDILLGFAVLMYGINFMSSAVYPLRESETFIRLLTANSNPLLGLLVGLVFTCVIQSASAAVGILQALAVTGAITFEVAFPMLMGIGIGASVPVLLSALGANADGRKTAYAYLAVDLIGAVIASVVFYTLNAVFHFGFTGTPLTMAGIALLNTLYRVAIVLVLSPFIGSIEKLMGHIVKEKAAKKTQDDLNMDRLEERFIKHPALAIEQSRITIRAMAERTLEALNLAIGLGENYSDQAVETVKEIEEIVDRYEDRLGTYLVKVMAQPIDKGASRIVGEYLHAITDFERISDHARNIAESFNEKKEKDIMLSDEGYGEISTLLSAVSDVADTAISSFIDDDAEKAYRVEPLEQVIDELCDEMKLHHIDRMAKGICTYSHSFVFNDLLTDLERVSDHCSNIAIAVIEREGDNNDAHDFLERIKNSHDGGFESLYENYSRKYYIEKNRQ